MRARSNKPLRVIQRQRGVALIMAILIVALATILAVNVASEGYMDQRRSSTMLGLDQALELSFGAEALAADVLVSDWKNNPKVDSLNEDWARPVELPVDEGIGEIKGNIEDLQGRFNLNNLLNPDGSENKESLRQFSRLLELLQMDTKWAGIIVDWIDADTVASFPDGAEDTVYTTQTPPYLTANMPITRTSELLSLVGFGLDNYRTLEPYITALPIGTPINVCTAPGKVLDSMSSRNKIVQYSVQGALDARSNGCFPTKKDVDNTFNSDLDYKDLLQKHTDYLSETTSYFRANILVSIGTTELTLYSVLHRTGSGKVQIALRSFGTP
jgi:general secretion pathway protein K